MFASKSILKTVGCESSGIALKIDCDTSSTVNY